MNRYDLMNFHKFGKEKEQRKEKLKTEFLLINRSLQNMLRQLRSKEIEVEFKELAKKLNRNVVQCSIWNIRYAINFHSPDVALAQIELIEAILKVDLKNNRSRMKLDLEKIKARLAIYGVKMK